MRRFPWVLVAYPFWVHLWIVLERPDIAVIGLAVLAALGGLTALWGRRLPAAGFALGGALLLLGVALADLGRELLYLPPVLFGLGFLLLFGLSLLPGRTPLVTRLAEGMGETSTEAMRAYTRRVTQAWTIFFAGLVVLSAGLALWAPPVVWSLFANFGSYLLVGLFFVVEFLIRHRLFPEHRYRRLRDFVGALIGGGWSGPRPTGPWR